MEYTLAKVIKVVWVPKEKFGLDFLVGVTCSNSYNLYKIAKNDGANYIALDLHLNLKVKKKKKLIFYNFLKLKIK